MMTREEPQSNVRVGRGSSGTNKASLRLAPQVRRTTSEKNYVIGNANSNFIPFNDPNQSKNLI